MVKMDIKRTLKHLAMTRGRIKSAFSEDTLAAIETAIKAGEAQYMGEICFVVEGALDPMALLRGQTPRERALEVFSQFSVWDTHYNNGILLYVLMADHAVEIVCDRGIHSREGVKAWDSICRQVEAAFKQGQYRMGAIAGIQALGATLSKHFPVSDRNNELPDRPIVL